MATGELADTNLLLTSEVTGGESTLVSIQDGGDGDGDPVEAIVTLQDDSKGPAGTPGAESDPRDISLVWEGISVDRIYPLPWRNWWRLWIKDRFQRQPPDHILKSVSGYVKSGTLLAVIGPSGAGKTTLLNCLTARTPRNLKVNGTVKVNGVELGRGIRDISAYVEQEELFYGRMTVEEHLMFRALLRMDNRLSTEEREKRVEEVILEFGLTGIRTRRIGVPGEPDGLSGGEKRRLAFATEVLTDPPLLFCDEPTSGLDSYMAESIVETLRNMAHSRRRAIVCTIHQPSSQVFDLFDEVMVLSDGRVAFQGTKEEAAAFFTGHGVDLREHGNPADYYINELSIIPGRELDSKERILEISNDYQKNKWDTVRNPVFRGTPPENPQKLIDDLNQHATYTSSWCTEFHMLLWRSVLTYYRHPLVFKLKILQPLFLAMIVGLIFHHRGMDQDAVVDINGVLFFILVLTNYSNINSVISHTPLDIPIVLKEYGIGVYRTDTFYLAKMLTVLPVQIVMSIAFTAVCYFTITLYRSVEAFFVCTAVLMFSIIIASSYATFVAYLTADVGAGLAFSTPIVVVLIVFGGFFYSNGSRPFYLHFLSYLSWFKYCFELMAVNQWDNVDEIGCFEHGHTPVPATNMTDFPCYRNGQHVLTHLYFKKENIAIDLIALTSMYVGFRVLAYIALLVRARCSTL